jgi:hypothetical protein
VIPSFSYDQHEILKNILVLSDLKVFDADLSYGNGKFYTDIPAPSLRFDVDPQVEGVVKASSDSIPLPGNCMNSIVFDPPFLTYVKQARDHNSIMAKRFGGYWRYDELEDHYRGTLKEAHRLLSKKGIMVFKCQDIIHNHKMHSTHINVVSWSKGLFRLKDMFILGAKHRIPMPEQEGVKKKVQKHARVFHSYFMVLEKI